MILKTLTNQYDMNLDYASRLLEGISDEQSVQQPAAGVNHPRWIIGHLAATADRVTGHWALGRDLRFDKDYFAFFGAGSEPKGDSDAYPPLAELLEYLTERHAAVAEALKSADESVMERAMKPEVPEGFRQRFPTVGHTLIYTMVGHEQMHLGQLSTWRRVCGMGCV